MTARFRLHQDVAVVEVGSASGLPVGDPRFGCIAFVGMTGLQIRTEDGASRCPAGGSYDDDGHSYRVVPVCCSCGEPITGTPVYAHDDPLHREWCSEECLDASAEASYEQHYRPEGRQRERRPSPGAPGHQDPRTGHQVCGRGARPGPDAEQRDDPDARLGHPAGDAVLPPLPRGGASRRASRRSRSRRR